MAKIVEGLWDCPYCGDKGIGGLKKHCPNCGHPQDTGTVFYMPGDITYLDEKTAKNYGNGQDWVCAYCDSNNRHNSEYCANCGAPREEKKGDYFAVQNQEAAKKAAQEQAEQEQSAPKKKKKRRLWPLLAGLLGIIVLITVLVMPKHSTARVTTLSWSRSISIEELTTLQESDWYIPDGGRVYDQREEIKCYEDVLDHYETVAVERSREVLDHYDEETYYVDNGDGTYSEESSSTPVYTTEYYTEYEEEPVYRQEPVYATKYYYEIDRWLETRSVDTEGNDQNPYWGEVTLGEKEREGRSYETYYVLFTTDKGKCYDTLLDEDIWSSLTPGESVKLTVASGNITKINDVPVN